MAKAQKRTTKRKAQAKSPPERSYKAVVQRHVEQFKNQELGEEISEQYAEDVLVLTPEGVYKGHSGVKKLNSELHERIGNGEISILSTKMAEPLAMVEWRCAGTNGVVCDGIDSFLIENGKIRYQMSSFEIQISDTTSGVHPTPDLAEGLRSDIEESLRRREAA